jgi:hypothetical protein
MSLQVLVLRVPEPIPERRSRNFPARRVLMAIFSSVSLRLECQVLFQMMQVFRVLHSLPLGIFG